MSVGSYFVDVVFCIQLFRYMLLGETNRIIFLGGDFLCVPVLPTSLASCQSFPLDNKHYLRLEPAGITINGKKIRAGQILNGLHRLGTGFDRN